jgi:TRAP-type mannitol/chloroaromatic compound transport system permease large subunit
MFGLDNPQLGVLMLVLFIFAIMLGYPIAFTLMALGFFFGYFALGDIVIQLVVQRTYSIMTNDVLISVPLFTFMGYIIDRSNTLDRMFKALQLAAGGIPASLAVVTMVICALWGIASGIVGAVVVLMGLLAMPAMLRAGYDARLTSGTICAGGTLGILIPPSVMLILYGATAGVSVVKLYAAAMIPGFGLTGAYLVYILSVGLLQPEKTPKPPRPEVAVPLAKVLYEVLVSFVPLTILTVVVLAVIFFGIATPTESAAVGAVGAFILAVAQNADYSRVWRSILVTAYVLLLVVVCTWAGYAGYHNIALGSTPLVITIVASIATCVALWPGNSFRWVHIKESTFLTARTSAMVCWLFIGSGIFSAVFAYLGGQAFVEQFVLSLGLSSVGFMIMAQLIIFVLGWPLEWTEIIIIFLPIFLPLLSKFDIDPLFFGVMVALNLQTSFLSPPVAMAPFYLKGVAPPHININEIFRGVYPFMWLVLVFMILMYMFPGMALWLPQIMYR